MEFKDIASVSGKGGLFKIVKPTRAGVILESLDGKNQRFVAGIQQRVSVLNEISIYTTTQEGSVPLEDVFKKIYEEFGRDTGLESSADGEELKAFLKHILPEYDTERVYVSDIKKIISWYSVILEQFPDLLTKAKSEPKSESEE